MKGILQEFAHGNISPDVQFFKRDSEYGKAMRSLSDNEDALRACLNEAQSALLENVLDAQAQLNSLTATDKFVCGYRLGMLMMLEVFAGREELIAGGEGR